MANKKSGKKTAKKKVGKKVTAGKDGKKGKVEDILGDPPEEKTGEKVEAEPAHVEEAFIRVRGTPVGGTRLMTQTEYDAYQKNG